MGKQASGPGMLVCVWVRFLSVIRIEPLLVTVDPGGGTTLTRAGTIQIPFETVRPSSVSFISRFSSEDNIQDSRDFYFLLSAPPYTSIQ